MPYREYVIYICSVLSANNNKRHLCFSFLLTTRAHFTDLLWTVSTNLIAFLLAVIIVLRFIKQHDFLFGIYFRCQLLLQIIRQLKKFLYHFINFQLFICMISTFVALFETVLHGGFGRFSATYGLGIDIDFSAFHKQGVGPKLNGTERISGMAWSTLTGLNVIKIEVFELFTCFQDLFPKSSTTSLEICLCLICVSYAAHRRIESLKPSGSVHIQLLCVDFCRYVKSLKEKNWVLFQEYIWLESKQSRRKELGWGIDRGSLLTFEKDEMSVKNSAVMFFVFKEIDFYRVEHFVIYEKIKAPDTPQCDSRLSYETSLCE